jgi:hypothetical protein
VWNRRKGGGKEEEKQRDVAGRKEGENDVQRE